LTTSVARPKTYALENAQENLIQSVNFEDIKLEPEEDFQDDYFDETKEPEEEEEEEEPDIKRIKLEMYRTKAEGLKLDNKYKCLTIENAQLQQQKLKLEIKILLKKLNSKDEICDSS
jgi:hypothetical protein